MLRLAPARQDLAMRSRRIVRCSVSHPGSLVLSSPVACNQAAMIPARARAAIAVSVTTRVSAVKSPRCCSRERVLVMLTRKM